MATPYKGKFTQFTNPEKYIGDVRNVTYRSLWERNAFRWADENPSVLEWASEEMVIHYDHPVYGRPARYFPDLFLKMADGVMRIIEIKPKKQTMMPDKPQRKTQKYINEVATYAVNTEKWKAAQLIAEKNNMTFEIWTEDTLKEMGILNGQQDKSILQSESTKSNKPKMRPVRRRKVKRPTRKS